MLKVEKFNGTGRKELVSGVERYSSNRQPPRRRLSRWKNVKCSNPSKILLYRLKTSQVIFLHWIMWDDRIMSWYFPSKIGLGRNRRRF
jgi:hypothetical protein